MENKISVIIPHVPLKPDLDQMLDDCVKSLSRYDELILVINQGMGYGKSFNTGFKYAKGDFLLAISNDTKLISGTLEDLCDKSAVTYTENEQFGCFFCLPRWVYEKTRGFDESFGLAYFEDDDFLLRLKEANIPLKRIEGVKIEHKGGITVKALNKEEESYQF